MKKYRAAFLAWLTSFVALTTLNVFFHGVLAYSFFYGRLQGIIYSPQEVHSSWVVLDYALLTSANLYFIFHLPRKSLAFQSAVTGGILGAVSFGTWNLINFAFIPNWPLAIVLLDIPWHIVVGMGSGWILGEILRRVKTQN